MELVFVHLEYLQQFDYLLVVDGATILIENVLIGLEASSDTHLNEFLQNDYIIHLLYLNI